MLPAHGANLRNSCDDVGGGISVAIRPDALVDRQHARGEYRADDKPHTSFETEGYVCIERLLVSSV